MQTATTLKKTSTFFLLFATCNDISLHTLSVYCYSFSLLLLFFLFQRQFSKRSKISAKYFYLQKSSLMFSFWLRSTHRFVFAKFALVVFKVVPTKRITLSLRSNAFVTIELRIVKRPSRYSNSKINGRLFTSWRKTFKILKTLQWMILFAF